MTQAQLDRSVARRTGESVRIVRSLGFQFQAGPSLDVAPEDPRLIVACPRCGVSRPLPRDRHGPAAMGECVPCDILFDYSPGDVGVDDVTAGGPRRGRSLTGTTPRSV